MLLGPGVKVVISTNESKGSRLLDIMLSLRAVSVDFLYSEKLENRCSISFAVSNFYFRNY